MAALKEENSRLKLAVRTLTPLVINRAAVARDVVDVCDLFIHIAIFSN